MILQFPLDKAGYDPMAAKVAIVEEVTKEVEDIYAFLENREKMEYFSLEGVRGFLHIMRACRETLQSM